jgi:hypothetical protein
MWKDRICGVTPGNESTAEKPMSKIGTKKT